MHRLPIRYLFVWTDSFVWTDQANFPMVRRTLERAFALCMLISLLGACEISGPAEEITMPKTELGAAQIDYPLDETVFPVDISSPKLIWSDTTPEATRWNVLINVEDDSEPLVFDSETTHWRPSPAQWKAIKKASLEVWADLAVVGLDASGNPVSNSTVRFRTSRDPVVDSIFYREVPLPFIKTVQDPSTIRWRFGTVDSSEQPPVVLEDLPVCGNCHSFSGDGGVLGLDVDYGNDKGGYAILPVEQNMVLNDEKIITWSDYKKDDGEATFGLLSQVSPDGRYVVSTVKDRAVFVATPGIEFSQLFFPIKGILVVYDTVTGSYTALRGADDPNYVQSNPTWSPDGEHIVFARSKVYRKPSIDDVDAILLDHSDVPEFIDDNEPFKFDLYRVPFNAGKGGVAEPIKGASHNGRSNFFAKFSPDGKWIVFTQAENYMLLMPDSELFIIPAEGGDARKLRANTTRMNSWHSFSSNGHWLVFSSKVNTPYTQLFLTHIDENGESTPPVVLDRFTGEYGAANIPEFVPIAGDAIAKIQEQFLDAYSFLRAGMANERTGNYAGAVDAYERGLAVSPENVELLNAKGFALFQQGDSAAAVEALEQAIRLDPVHWKSHNNMALASVDLGELELAEVHYRESLAIEPQPAIYNDLGTVLERQGLGFEAIDAYESSLALDPDFAAARFNLASSFARNGEYAKAEQQFRVLLEQEASPRAETGLGVVLWQQDKRDEAIEVLQQVIKNDPSNPVALDQLGKMLLEVGRSQEGRALLARAAALESN